MMHLVPDKEFDREPGLKELLSGVDPAGLHRIIDALLDGDVRLVDAAGGFVLGAEQTPPGAQRRPLCIDIEPIGYLESSDAGRIGAVGRLIELLLKSSHRYQMASRLHLEAVQADYEKLQRKHRALQASEARLRELTEHLEQRVQEQVHVIEDSQRQLYQAEKLASVGQLAAGIAHEINNPIGFIRSNLETAQQYVRQIESFARMLKQGVALEQAWRREDMDFLLEDFQTLVQENIDGADRVARIVSDLKEFSNVDQGDDELADINRLIETVTNVAASQIQQKADVSLQLGSLPPTRCNPGHLGQVFLNMLQNSAQAMGDKRGKITLVSEAAGDTITVRIIDDGKGIPPEQLSRIFDPFFTTQDVGQGTGLGLTVSRDIIAAHGGSLDVESRPGEGTAFTIRLPVKR
ncbi:MAG TPA: two-component sensor histidine kinase [Sedimenticola sp.]|nr:two-component sensor histidine kinase [Sedimenticola sp.]